MDEGDDKIVGTISGDSGGQGSSEATEVSQQTSSAILLPPKWLKKILNQDAKQPPPDLVPTKMPEERPNT